MTQTAIPYLFLRGGSSRGPYMNRADLPQDLETLSKVLVSLVGSGHPFNIDGIGGGTAVTTKVAMLSKSEHPWADIDYFFAQVGVENRLVDYKPSCGNILVGVGPAAIEMGLVAAQDNRTEVKIHAVNTGSLVSAQVETPQGQVNYSGSAAIDGVPGTAAPVHLNFMEVEGSITGQLFPTGNRTDQIDGVSVTCMDVAMPMVIARAEDFGVTGYEAPAELDANSAFMQRMEAVRLEAAKRMGMGDATQSVTPKFGLLAPAKDGGSAATRYFMPWNCHPTLAVTGSQCIASCLLATGTVGAGIMPGPNPSPCTLHLEHPMGKMEVVVAYQEAQGVFAVHSAGLVRTARKLAEGRVFCPETVWAGN